MEKIQWHASAYFPINNFEVYLMKRKRILCTALFILTFLLLSKILAVARAEKSIPIKENLFRVDFVGTDLGWAVGYYGKIVHTVDGGKTWATQEAGVNKLLSGVDFVDADNGWVVGYGPTILNTKDGGKTWSAQKSLEKIFLSSIHFANTQKGWAAGEYGTILYTENGGDNWVKQFSSEDAMLYDISFFDEANGMAVGEFGTVFLTTDGGKQWATSPTGVDNVFFSCQALDAKNLWAVGIDSIVLHSTDSGASWETIDTKINKVLPFYRIKFRDTKNGIICGQGFSIVTNDGGKTWKFSMFKNSDAQYMWMGDITFTGTQTAWCVGAHGRILNSENNGESWKETGY